MTEQQSQTQKQDDHQQHHLVVLYGIGGLSDVGRHAIEVALTEDRYVNVIQQVTVITKYPEKLLEETKWNCGCEHAHGTFSTEQKERMNIVQVHDWHDDADIQKIKPHIRSATAIISCLGNRQPLTRPWDAADGNRVILQALLQENDDEKAKLARPRCIVLTSTGLNEDWPPMESWMPGKIILSAMYLTCGYWTYYRDLSRVECMYRDSNKSSTTTKSNESKVNYLLVRPMGIGEDVKPVGMWTIQKEKYKDKLGYDMSKLDLARFMVQEAIHPSIIDRDAVSVGADPIPFYGGP